VLTTVRAALPAPAIEAKFDTRSSSANAIVAAEFSDAAPDAVMPSDVTSSLRQGLMLQALAGLEAAPPENEATSQQDRPLAASPNPDEGELPYLKYYVYSESPPPEKPAKIALAALSHVPLGTPVREIERAAEAFGVDANFMKAVAKIESDFNPRERTGSYIGLFQLSKSEFSEYGSGEILNPRENAMAAAYKFVTEAALFEVITHKKPTFPDLYLIHQQGWEGSRRTRQPSAADCLEVDVRNPGRLGEGRAMVQARHLGQHAAGGQTRMEVGRSPYLGRVRGDVAGPRRHALCPLSSVNAAAAGGLRSNSLRLRTPVPHIVSSGRCVGNLRSPVSDAGSGLRSCSAPAAGLIPNLDRCRSEARAHRFTSNNGAPLRPPLYRRPKPSSGSGPGRLFASRGPTRRRFA